MTFALDLCRSQEGAQFVTYNPRIFASLNGENTFQLHIAVAGFFFVFCF